MIRRLAYEYRLEVIEERGCPELLRCFAERYTNTNADAWPLLELSAFGTPSKTAPSAHAQICKPLGQILGARVGQALSARVLATTCVGGSGMNGSHTAPPRHRSRRAIAPPTKFTFHFSSIDQWRAACKRPDDAAQTGRRRGGEHAAHGRGLAAAGAPRARRQAGLLPRPALCAAAAVEAVARRATSSAALYGRASAAPCTDVEKLEISKYTIRRLNPQQTRVRAKAAVPSTRATGATAARRVGLRRLPGRRQVQDAHPPPLIARRTMDLHDASPPVTPHGPVDGRLGPVPANLNEHSFATDVFNPFMHGFGGARRPPAFATRELPVERAESLARRGGGRGGAYRRRLWVPRRRRRDQQQQQQGLVDVKDWSAAECPLCRCAPG